MLFTGKGDGGTSKLFSPGQRESKQAPIFEALGTVDELNSLLGWCKLVADSTVAATLTQVQHNLFIIQAGLAGADKMVAPDAVTELEKIINEIETKLPPIKTFFLAGGSESAARLYYARRVARRAERRVVALGAAPELMRAYLNRLSSLLYALARLANHQSGITEEAPNYR